MTDKQLNLMFSTDYYRQGYDCAMCGGSEYHNPYDFKEEAWSDWINGFWAARFSDNSYLYEDGVNHE